MNRKTPTNHLPAWLILGCAFGISHATAGTFSSSTTAPVVNGSDIANLATPTGSDKWFFQTSNEANPSDAAKGQTFITGSTELRLKALSYKISSGNMKAAQTTYTVRVGTVSGTTFTQIASETFQQTSNTASGAYMTWTFTTPVLLQPNTTYAIDVGMKSAVSYTTGIPYLSYTGNISNARIGTYYDSGDLGVGNSTLDFTTARDRIFHLDLEHPQNPSPENGATVPAGNVVLSWANLTPTTGTNVWADVWFGTGPSSLTKVVSAALNRTTHTVSAPTAATYYWRVDNYLNGVSTGTPTTGSLFQFIVADTDGDGMPDAFELLHTSPASGTALAPGDDPDADGLTNLQEYQLGTLPLDPDTDKDTLTDGGETAGVGSRPPTSPTKADTDGDGVNDGAESNTGLWVNSSNRGTNPTKTDTDGDGLTDNVETHTGTYVSETNTGTHPLQRDTDGDNAEDWYEVAASYTNPTLASSKPPVPYPLPDPDNSTGTGTKPVKVFILSGQSNMVGFGRVAGTDIDTLQSLTQTEKKFPNLITSANAWTVRQDVLYRGVISALGNAPLAPGFGESSASFGPELGFGHVVGYVHDEPVLVIKTSIGNRSLGWDYLPPGSTRYTYGGVTYAGYGDYTKTPGSTTVPANWYAGKQFDDGFLHEDDMGAKAWASGLAYVTGSQVKHGGKTYSAKNNHSSTTANQPVPGGNSNWAVYSVFNVCDILDNFATQYPQWASRGFEIGGFGWFQGWNDGQSSDTEYAVRYEQNLVRLIKQLRLYYNGRYPGKIQPDSPFVTVTCGFDGFAAAGNRLTVANAQLAVANPSRYPEFAGNVKSMEGRGYWRSTGPNTSQNYHYWHNAETYMLVGDAMGRGMIELIGTNPSQLSALTISGGMLSPSFAGSTFTYSAVVASPTVTVTPTLAGASITVNGSSVVSGSTSAPISLNFGTNTITVASTVSGETSIYTLTITRSADSYTWNQDQVGPTSWNTAAHWTPDIGIPNSIDVLANLTNNITRDNQIHLTSPVIIGSLNIGDASGDSAFIINSGPALTFDVSTGSATLARIAAGTAFDTINAPLVLADPLTSTVTNSTGSLTINGSISETGGARSFTKNGAGSLVLTGNNTFTGSTILSQGSLQIQSLKNYSTASSLGAPASGNIIISATNSSNLIYTGTGDSSNRSIQIGPSSSAGVTATIANNGTGALIFTAPNFNTPVGITAGNAARSLALGGSFGDTATPNEVRGIISDNTLSGATAPANRVSLIKNGVGTWRLTAANTYTGNTTIAAGTLLVASNVIPSSPLISIGNGATLQSSAGFTLAANQSVTGTGATGFITTSTSTGLITAGGSTISSSGTLALTRFSILGSGNQITDGNIESGGPGSFQRGLLVGNNGSGVLTLSGGSFTSNGGNTNPDVLGASASSGDGTLIIDGGAYLNTASTGTLSLGNGQASGTLTITSGSATLHTLRFQAGNSGTKTRAVVNLDGGNLTLSNITVSSGLTKEFNFNGGQFVAGANLPTFSGLTLNVKNGGARIDTNGFSFALTDPLLNFGGTSSGGLRKSGLGTLTLAGANTYAGATEITEGTLTLGANNVLPDSPVSIGNATLDAATRSESTGTLDVTGSATLQFETGAALAFANSSGIDWSGGTLTLSGSFVSGSSLRFGTSGSGLSPAQLALINRPGGAAFALDASGYLIEVPFGGYASWAALHAPSSTPTEDQDGDGVANAVEFILGGTADGDDSGKLPMVTVSGGQMEFSFKRNQASIVPGCAVIIETGNALDTWSGVYQIGADTASSSPGVSVLKNVPAGYDTVTLSLPISSSSKKFARLKVVLVP